MNSHPEKPRNNTALVDSGGPRKAVTPPDKPRSSAIVHILPADFSGALTENLAPAELPGGVFRVKDTSRAARLTSGVLTALFPFDQLAVSTGVLLPGGGALGAEACVKTPAGWSPWFSFGRYTREKGGASVKNQKNSFGKMDIDLLKLAKKASAFRYRLTIFPAAGAPAVIKLAAAAYTDSGAAYAPDFAINKPAWFKPLKLQLPGYSQMVQRVTFARDICSPVSLAMAFCGLGRPTGPLEPAARVLDSAENIYGNWFFNTSYAGTEGFYAFLSRLNTLEEARTILAAGIQVIASVTFGPGELEHSPLEKTRGHLLVIKGFTAGGDVITNDPAAPAAKTVERVYDRAQFASAWLKNKYGTAYIVARDINTFLAVKSPVTDLFSRPPGSGKQERAKLIESQLLANERVELLETAGGWARVKALEQAHLQADKKTLAPYEGWLRLGDLVFSLPLPCTAVVRTKTAEVAGREVSIGVKFSTANEPGTLPAEISLNALPVMVGRGELRKNIIETARLFLGDKYHWGGRSAWGVDCSGLVNLAYRAWGLDLPRNAAAQFAAARRLPAASLEPGDLIFTSDSARPDFISHVMLYSGKGRLIEATRDTNNVREVSFIKKFGVALEKLESGRAVNGKMVFFGTVIGQRVK